jgi:hypothetical protein
MIGTAVSLSAIVTAEGYAQLCRTYPVHPAINDISDGPTCFPEGFTYDEYVVHPNPALNRIRSMLNVKDMRQLTEKCNWDDPSAKYRRWEPKLWF